MVHDPWCFKAFGRCIMGPSTVCNMPASRARNTSIGGQFGFGIFVGIQRNTPVFIMVYPDSKALHALLFCFGFGRKEDGKIETATLEERQKSNWSIKQNNNFARALFFLFFLYISLLSMHDHNVKMLNFQVFVEDANKLSRNFPSLSTFDKVSE